MTIKRLGLLMVILAGCCFSSCYYDVDEEINPPDNCDVNEVRYSRDLLPVLRRQCYVCHSLNQTVSDTLLEPHTELAKHALRPYFMPSIRKEPNFEPMPPQEAKLDDCTLRMFQAWIDQGAPDN